MSMYNYCIAQYVSRFAKVDIPPERLETADEWIDQMIHAKMQEEQWRKDFNAPRKRLLTGLLGELAVETLTETEFIDWSISSNSADYNKPDMEPAGYNVGIRSVEYGNRFFPAIFSENSYPQIITIVNTERKSCYVCGIATPDVLNKYQDQMLIKDRNMRNKGKTGFYGFEFLLGIEELNKFTVSK